MAAPMENLIILDLTATYGATQVGTWLAAAIWGISTLQTFIYFTHTGDADPASLRFMISALWVLDSTNTVLEFKGNWRVLIHQYGRIAGLLEIQPEIMIHTMIGCVVVFVVQMYFIRRIYMFGKQSIFRSDLGKLLGYASAFVMTALASWQIIGTIVYQSFGYGTPLATLSTHRLVDLNMSLRAAAVAVDTTVAVCMLYLLSTRGKGNFQQTKRMVHRLILVTVTSGTITAISATVVLILLAVYPADLYYVIAEYSLCSLYFSTLLANLNTRAYVQGRSHGNIITTGSFVAREQIGVPAGNTLVLSPLASSNITGVRVHHDFDQEVDYKVTEPSV